MNTFNNIPEVERLVNEALIKATHGFAEVLSLTVTNSYSDGDYHVSEYTGVACLARPCAVSTANSTHLETNTDLTKLVDIPNAINVPAPSVYQVWKQGTVLPFTGKGYFKNTDNGWDVAMDYYGQPYLNTQFSAEAKPEKFLIFMDGEDGKCYMIESTQPYIHIDPPAEAQVHDFLVSHVEYLTDGVQRLKEFKIVGEPKIDRLLEGGQDGYVDAEIVLEFAAPAVSVNRSDILPAPKIGEDASDTIDEEAYEKGCFWETGVSIPYEARIRFKKESADFSWKFSTMSSINPVKTPLTSKQALRVRYKEMDEGMKVHDATVILK